MDKLQTNRSTDYYCGNGISFEVVAPYIAKRSGDVKIAICSDRVVSGYYYNKFEEQFLKLGMKPLLVPVDARTSSKGLTSADTLFKALVDFDFGKNDWLIAFGGGGVIDICGFAASVFTGGINLMAVPTTLGSMIDGVLADKAFLNSSGHKDEISVPFSPTVAIIDPLFLNTVPPKVRANGYASVIRLALLDNIELLSGIEGKGDFRVYINDIYKSRMAVEDKDPYLLTLGDELSDAIESYFRFMNYSEGEALALSLLATVSDSKREPLTKIYGALGLPIRLEGCTEKMMIKTLKENFSHKGVSKVKMADRDGGKWHVFEYDADEAMKILENRLKRIIE